VGLKLAFSPRAALDLEEIGDYIALDNPSRAVSFMREIKQHCRSLARRPAAFPVREDLAAGIRMAVNGNYLIFFRVLEKTVREERVIHGASQPQQCRTGTARLSRGHGLSLTVTDQRANDQRTKEMSESGPSNP
jgi:toxin ParE1/3/4